MKRKSVLAAEKDKSKRKKDEREEDAAVDDIDDGSLIDKIIGELDAKADPVKGERSRRYFKADENFDGGTFIGLSAPIMRDILKKYFKSIKLDLVLESDEFNKLLRGDIHEYRSMSSLILVELFRKNKGVDQRKRIADFVLENKFYINSWDLVDNLAPNVLGPFVHDSEEYRKQYEDILLELAKSDVWWHRRLSVISFLHYIRKKDYSLALEVFESLLSDSHDLIHKGAGWMLREIGKRDEQILVDFLEKHAIEMPRTMLRYSIEKFDEPRRQHFLKMKKKNQ